MEKPQSMSYCFAMEHCLKELEKGSEVIIADPKADIASVPFMKPSEHLSPLQLTHKAKSERK